MGGTQPVMRRSLSELVETDVQRRVTATRVRTGCELPRIRRLSGGHRPSIQQKNSRTAAKM